MSDSFTFDVFLSHSSKDKLTVRDVAERLRADGLRVWFDDWQLRPGDSVPAKVEQGLEESRVLVLCMSANAFGSDWAQLESYTFRFRDPLNKYRRFIPVRLDEAPVRGSLAQFVYINWSQADHEMEYAKLLEACLPPTKLLESPAPIGEVAEKAIQLDCESTTRIWSYAFGPDGKRSITGGSDNTVRLWDIETGRCLRVFEGHTGEVSSVAWSANERQISSGARDNTVRLWDVETGRCLRVLKGHTSDVRSVAWKAGGSLVLSGSGGARRPGAACACSRVTQITFGAWR
jgi:hypothetical protein